MYLFEIPFADDPTFRFLITIIIVALVVWRLLIMFNVSRKKPKKFDSKVKSTDNRRSTINLLDLERIHWDNIFKPKQDSNPFYSGLLFVVFGAKGLGCLGSVVLVIIITIAGTWTLSGYDSIKDSLWKVLPVLLVLYVLTVGSYLITYLYAYYKEKDFRYLLEGLITKDDEKKLEAFQKAVRTTPTEYGFAKLAEVQKRLTDKQEALLDKIRAEFDYTQAIEYYHKASSINPSAMEPIEARIPLKRRMKDYDGILEDITLLKEIEKGQKNKSYYCTDKALAITLDDWGKDLMIAGQLDKALEKLTEGLSTLIGYTEGSVHYPLWSLHIHRASCYYEMGQYESAIKDNYAAIKKLLERLHELINRDSGTRHRDELARRRDELEEELTYVYKPFKVEENIQGAIDFFYYFYNQKDKVFCPVFANHLFRLLMDVGERDQLKNLYQDYIAEGFSRIEWLETRKKFDYSSEEAFLLEMKRIRRADFAPFNFLMALKKQYFDLAIKYLNKALKAGPEPSVFVGAGQLMEKQWKYSKALEYYIEGFSLLGSGYSDERAIGRIKKIQRAFEEAHDCYKGLLLESKEKGEQPSYDDIATLAQIKDELGDYEGALELLSSYRFDKSYRYNQFVEIREKKIIKERILNS